MKDLLKTFRNKENLSNLLDEVNTRIKSSTYLENNGLKDVRKSSIAITVLLLFNVCIANVDLFKRFLHLEWYNLLKEISGSLVLLITIGIAISICVLVGGLHMTKTNRLFLEQFKETIEDEINSGY